MQAPLFEQPINKFISKTYRLVNDQTSCKGPIKWSKNGRSFEVTDINSLGQLMPLYFNSDKYSSFIRQLNIYGFQIIKKGKITTFRHPYFVRDHQADLWKIRNKKAYSSPSSGYGPVLKQIEQYKLSCKLLDDKLQDLKNQERKIEENHQQGLKVKEHNLKSLLGVTLSLLKLSTNENRFKDLFEDLKAVNPLFKQVDGFPNFQDFAQDIEKKGYNVDGSVKYLCEYIMENIQQAEREERSFNLSFFDGFMGKNKGEEKEEQLIDSGLFVMKKEEAKHHFIYERTDHKRFSPEKEEDISFKLMEDLEKEPRNVNRILDFK